MNTTFKRHSVLPVTTFICWAWLQSLREDHFIPSHLLIPRLCLYFTEVLTRWLPEALTHLPILESAWLSPLTPQRVPQSAPPLQSLSFCGLVSLLYLQLFLSIQTCSKLCKWHSLESGIVCSRRVNIFPSPTENKTTTVINLCGIQSSLQILSSCSASWSDMSKTFYSIPSTLHFYFNILDIRKHMENDTHHLTKEIGYYTHILKSRAYPS